jgi:hypothetical protein
MIMLTMVALPAASTRRERWAAFIWAFAFWDLSYYAGLWTTSDGRRRSWISMCFFSFRSPGSHKSGFPCW